MSDASNSNSTAIVAIVAVVVIAVAVFFGYQNGMFGGHKEKAGVGVELNFHK